jgi:hypothetical protein
VRTTVAGLALGVAACAPAAAPVAPSTPAPTTTAALAPATALDALEQRLIAAPSFRIRARLASSGRIQSHFDGTVAAGPGSRMRFALQGAFGNRDADALFTCDGRRMRGGHQGGHPLDLDAAPGLREGVVVGFVRMGLLHDVARLATGKPPDYIDGSARSHLTIVGAVRSPGEVVRGAPTEQWDYALQVDGKRTSDVTVWLDARSGLPVRRRVVVHFPEGDMDVGEEYDELVVDGPVPEETFRIEP